MLPLLTAGMKLLTEMKAVWSKVVWINERLSRRSVDPREIEPHEGGLEHYGEVGAFESMVLNEEINMMRVS